ncbi:lipoyl(octanoyl) transferase LipB [Candidatus Contubernalis alkaliaceticus]|uniref:lipoyl(octanoyl) transferase LipB n=1 Tax=Candidatus Contubernalis alkaliaceticus TaxID=338645 RepID=UPI001F4BEDAD|nr:lipoyl(octanoyl) transferase LipB [Candidatus Contubernalis alkalaceticus]UNC93406.1 lipoyl(octanoyl) transferase LipB [Candidatus Contubernalis alkalaceticus]
MLQVIDWGSMEYSRGYEQQQRLVKARSQELIPDTLILVSHPPVFTIGCRGSRKEILASEDVLKGAGISVKKVDRGGAVTYHGPGQLVVYPILDLRSQGRNLHDLIYKYEAAVISTLKCFRISAGRNPEYIGVWVSGHKICAVGIGVKHWISYHGLALNISTNLDHYNYIVPCGITHLGITSMEKVLNKPVQHDEVKKAFVKAFIEEFGY